ncbi:MAG: signal recognition particle protein [Planctomycetota bacterium]
MFESLSSNLTTVLRKFGLRGKLTESDIRDGMREVRIALLEADVNYRVVKDFVDEVTAEAVGEHVLRSVQPSQQIVKIVHDRLVALMGPADSSIPFAPDGPTVLMLAGLQGSGKTTTCAKLARFLAAKGKRPLLVAADIRRPAAIEQLQILGKSIDVPVFFQPNTPAPRICHDSLREAADKARDVVILDTAGRLHIDDEMMRELEEVVRLVKPHQTYLVCDAMTGQDAVNSAAEFDRRLALDGVILTKLDGDARGGAALSTRKVTGKPIKFVTTGEKLDRLEEFHPDRMAGRILGMGDVVSLVERAQQAIDAEEAAKLREKLRKAAFTLDDFLTQLNAMQKMGPLQDVLALIPGFGARKELLDQVDPKELVHTKAVIQSMTPGERNDPDTIDHSRRNRIARGCGTTPGVVNDLLKQFRMMRDMMRKFDFSKASLAGAPGRGGPALALSGLRKKGPAMMPKKKKEKKRKKHARRRR